MATNITPGSDVGFFEDEVKGLEVGYPHLSKFRRTAREFAGYIAGNTTSLINYGERYRGGERISSCLAESTVNAAIIKRFAKRQQMQAGTHETWGGIYRL